MIKKNEDTQNMLFKNGKMGDTTFIAFCTSGLEGALANELRKNNYKIIYSSSGRIFFTANLKDTPSLNTKLKAADRIAVLISQFYAETFDELYDSILKSDIKNYVEPNAKITIEKVKVTNSKLSATGAIASITKKAILDNLKGSNETGPEYPFIIILKDDTVYLSLDTTGSIGLHKRGYRIKTSKAPIRETIAAGIIILSHWNNEIPLFDPFCGSGTIPIEAATLEVPNISRKYVSENWKILKNEWEIIKKNNGKSTKTEHKKIYASDVDCQTINIAKENYNRAKKLFSINTSIYFKCTDFRKLPVFNEPAYVISNFPYGQRIEVDILKEISTLKEKFPKGKFYLVHPSEDFEKHFGKATKKFKFQNSGIWTYLYMYY